MSINGRYPRNRARFNLTHTHKLSCKDGLLVPCLCEQILPGGQVESIFGCFNSHATTVASDNEPI